MSSFEQINFPTLDLTVTSTVASDGKTISLRIFSH